MALMPLVANLNQQIFVGKEWTRILQIRKCYKVWSTSKTYNNKPIWALLDSNRISIFQPFQMHSAGPEFRQLCLAALHQAQLPPNMQHLKLNLEVEDQAMWSKPRCQGLLHFVCTVPSQRSIIWSSPGDQNQQEITANRASNHHSSLYYPSD